jgi:hypothetical protein
MNDQLIGNVLVTPPPEDTQNEEPIDTQQSDLTCTPVPTRTNAHKQVVRVDNARQKAYGKATGWYNKHRKYSEQWNPWHPFWSAHDLQQAQSFTKSMKTGIDQHLRRGLDNFKTKSFKSANALDQLFAELDFSLGYDSWIEDDSHIFGTLYFRDIFQCIQFLLEHLPCQAHHDFEPVRLADWKACHISSEMNSGNWWWDTQDELPAGAMIVPVICVTDQTHLTNVADDQHAWLLYLEIGHFRNDICWTPQ